MSDVLKLARAYHFAASWHVGQRRKGEAAEPYINHLTEVGELVAVATDGADSDLVVAAVLHDIIEDTPATAGEIATVFGPRIAALVAEVTDDKGLPKTDRKRLQVEHARHASSGAKIIKLADKISNLRSLVSSPPANWRAERKVEYLRWAQLVVSGCRGASAWLEAEFDRSAIELEAKLSTAARSS